MHAFGGSESFAAQGSIAGQQNSFVGLACKAPSDIRSEISKV